MGLPFWICYPKMYQNSPTAMQSSKFFPGTISQTPFLGRGKFVLSRLDYCNAFLAGLPNATPAPLQQVLNALARVILNLKPRDHVTSAKVYKWQEMKCPFEHRKYDFLFQCTGTLVWHRYYRRLFTSWPKSHGVLEISWTSGESGCIRPCSYCRLIKPHIILSKLIISQTNCKITW